MENLLLGVLIGGLLLAQASSALGLYFLYQRNNKLQKQLVEAYRQIAANKNQLGDNFLLLDGKLIDLKKGYDRQIKIFSLKFTQRNERFNKRLLKLEKIPLPEHLSLTTQQIVNREIEKQISERENAGTSLLEITRHREIEAYNRENNHK